MTLLRSVFNVKAVSAAVLSCAFILPCVSAHAASGKNEITIKGMSTQNQTPPPAIYQPAPIQSTAIDAKAVKFKEEPNDPFDTLPPLKPEQQGLKMASQPSAGTIPAMFLDEKTKKPIQLLSVELDKAAIEPYLVNVLGDYGINIIMDARGAQQTPEGVVSNACVLNLRLRDVELWHTVNLITKMCGMKLELDEQNSIVHIFHPNSAMAIAPYTGQYKFKYLQVASHLNDNYLRVTGVVKDGGGAGNKAGISSLKEIVEIILGVKKSAAPAAPMSVTVGRGLGITETAAAEPVLQPDSEVVAINETTNSIIIRGEEGKVKEAIRVLEEMDHPAPQVKIQAWIIETSSSVAKQIGLRWSGKFYFDNGVAWGGSRDIYDGATQAFNYPLQAIARGIYPPTGKPDEDGWMPAYEHETSMAPYSGELYSIGAGITTSAGSLVAEMQALESTGDINILSQPELTVQDNREATITSGRDLNVRISTSDDTDVKTIPAKLIATITPHVSPENTLMMRVTLQNRYPDIKTIDGIPEVLERSIDTTLMVKNGETIVLGGLKVEKDNRAVDGVPYLKDLPLLGYIFRYEEDRNDTDELLLIVRPTIIPVGSKRDVVYAPVTELNHTSIK